MERELVVSRYDEDVSWVKGWKFPVSLYNKGTPLLDFDSPNIDVIDVPNRGREAGTWLLHICDNYDDLAEWTFFVQGTPHANDLRGRCAVDYPDTTGLTTEYLPHFPTAEVKAMDRVERVGGYEVRYGLADPVVSGRCDACDSACDDVWSRWFTGDRPDPWWFSYAAEYSVPRHRILARPRDFWIACLEAVSNSDNSNHKGITTAWAFELLWLYLWGDAEQYPVRSTTPEPAKSRRMSLAEARAAGLVMSGGCGCGK